MQRLLLLVVVVVGLVLCSSSPARAAPGRFLRSDPTEDALVDGEIDSEDIDVRLNPVDLDHCLEEVSATCRNLISHNGNTFDFEKHEELGTIPTDETRLRQILINLLGNAGKFTKNGRVVLRARRETADVTNSICDFWTMPPSRLCSIMGRWNPTSRIAVAELRCLPN